MISDVLGKLENATICNPIPCPWVLPYCSSKAATNHWVTLVSVVTFKHLKNIPTVPVIKYNVFCDKEV